MAYATCPKWKKERMTKKMRQLAGMDGLELEEGSIDDPAEYKRLNAIVAAMGKAKPEEIEIVKEIVEYTDDQNEVVDVEIVDEPAKEEAAEEEAVEEEAVEEPKPKAKKEKKSKPKAKKEKKPKAEKDVFGFCKGTKASAFCACLSKKPMTMKELMNQAGTEVTCYGMLRKLCQKGLVVCEDRKYSLVQK